MNHRTFSPNPGKRGESQQHQTSHPKFEVSWGCHFGVGHIIILLKSFFSIFNHQNCAESIRVYTKVTRSVHVEEKYSNWWFRLLKWGFWRELSGQPLCHILNTRFVECIRRKITFKHGEDCRKGGLKERFAAIFFCQVINRRHVKCAHEKEWLCYGLDCKKVVWKRYLWSQPVVS